MGLIYVVTNGSPAAPPIAYFSTKAKAQTYIEDVIKRYEQGKALALHGRHLTPDFGNWKLGLGPQVHERDVDKTVEH